VPFCHLTFLVDRQFRVLYERRKTPDGTLGAAFRAQRCVRRMDQRQAAQEIGVSVATYRNWELNRTSPDLRHVPAAIRFLGRDWRSFGDGIGDQLRRARTAAGLSIKALSTILDSDESAICRWEAGISAPSRRSLSKVRSWLSRREQ
jgi:transcriptional regulator with XRE-family HTH domain